MSHRSVLAALVLCLLQAMALAVENAATPAAAAAAAGAAVSCEGSSQLSAVSEGRCSLTCREVAIIGACGNASSSLCERVDLNLKLDCSRSHLDSNETRALSADPAFARFLPWVRDLNLARTRLPLIARSHLESFDGLVKLSLQDVGAVGFEPRALLGPGRQLRSLDLAYNRLGLLPADLLADTPRLETLDLSDNPASVVTENPDLLQPLADCLRTLRLNGLGLTVLPVMFLQPLVALDALYMARNRLTELEAISFHGLRFPFLGRGRLTLDFDRNEIGVLGNFAFASIRLPLTLTLQHNRISQAGFLRHPTVDSADPCRWDSSSVALFGNPLQCGCELYNFTRVKINAAAITGVCSGPAGFEKHLLYGWRYGHAHRAMYFEKTALSLCRSQWRWRDSERAANESVSWRQFGAQFSCRCGRWFDPEREFLHESNCAIVSRAEVHAHDSHGLHEHEHDDKDTEDLSPSAAAAAASAEKTLDKKSARMQPSLLSATLLLAAVSAASSGLPCSLLLDSA